MDTRNLCIADGARVTELTSLQLFGLLAALGGGMLVGAQRERHKGEHTPVEPAGVRTFTIVALIGAVAAYLGAATLLLSGAAVAAFAVAAYLPRVEHDPGLTTEVAMLATWLLGALAMSTPSAAAALFVVVVVLLQAKQALHHFTRNVLSEQELGDALLLAASVLIVLPMLPDRTFDPYAVLNPRRIWLFAVLVMTINAVGYIALRLFGSGRGLLLAGFFGGFISSAATIAGLGQRARRSAALRASCVAAALLSNIATIVLLILILLAAAPAMLHTLLLPLLLTGLTAVAVAALFVWRSNGSEDDHEPKGRPFAPIQAVLFAAIVAAAAFLAALLREWMGSGGIVIAAAAAGFTDVHAVAVSLAQLSNAGADGVLAYALLAAFTANSIMKCVAAGTGGRAYAGAVIAGVAAINLTLLLALLLQSGA